MSTNYGSLIQFDTKVWENDYRIILSANHLRNLANTISLPSENIRIIVNNVWSKRQVKTLANRAKNLGLIGEFFFVDEYANEALKFFGLDKVSLGIGYRYSICELVAIYLSEKPYMMHLSSDSLPSRKIDDRFFEDSIRLLSSNQGVKVTNFMWNNSHQQHISEADREDNDFYYSRGGFSDQMYFVRREEFQDRIYEENHPESERYPSYGGPLFEKRVDSLMRTNGYFRATYKHNTYNHQNFTRRISSRLLNIVHGTGN